jgi:branched-chain amino acid transport system permease protein
MRLVNIAHGDLIVLGAFIALVVAGGLGVHPFLTLIAVVPIMFAIGYLLQRSMLNRTIGDDILPPLLVTFGLAIVIQNVLLEIFSADTQRLQAGRIETASIQLGETLAIGWFPLIVFLTAVAVIAALQALSYRTELGRAFRATSDDPDTAQLMGINNQHIYALAMGISLAVCAIASVFLAIRTNFDPAIGPSRLIYAFEAVIMGGLGNLWGTLAGGVVLGLAQSIGARIDPGFQILAGHIAFLFVLMVRPRGMFPRLEQ